MSNTSPDLPVDDGLVHSAKEFSDVLTQELNDDEIKRAFELIVKITEKWHQKFVQKFRVGAIFSPESALEELDKFEEELKYELATKLHVYATVDPTPVFEGEPPIVEIIGALPSHPIATHGFDHEKKTWEVQHATERGEDYYGQKGKHKKRDGTTRPSTKPASS
jgi:hypothetical protein